VLISDEELKALQVESSKIIDLTRFVDRDEVDQVYFDAPYYVYPDGELAVEAFRVIGQAMAAKGLFTAADMPNENRLTVGIMAMVAEEERRAISERTKAALAAAKARGVKLGGRPESLKNTELGRERGTEARRAKAAARAKDLAPVIEAIRAEGITSATGIAKALNERGIPSARRGKWQAVQVLRLERA
jgi:DNA invertase Pin-like site-specific DNA recombinase